MSEKLEKLEQEDLGRIDAWFKENENSVPEPIKIMYTHFMLFRKSLDMDAQRRHAILRELRRALGIIAKSERKRSSDDPVGAMSKPGDARPKNKRERLLLSQRRAKDLSNWHSRLAYKQKNKAKKIGDEIMSLDDIELTPEEEAELDAKHEKYLEHLLLGFGEGGDPAFEQPKKAFMEGAGLQVNALDVTARVSPEVLAEQEVISRISEERTRYSFSLTLEEINIEVEKVIVRDPEGGTKMISASTKEFGPGKMEVTWDFLTNLTILVSQYAMPFNRLGNMLSVPDKRFTSGMLTRMFTYVAERFLPIYLHYFEQLANSSILSGDDTSPRVLEVSRYFQALEENPEKKDSPPWKDYANEEIAGATVAKNPSPDLAMVIAEKIGFESERKDGTGQKKGLQTTVLWGRSEADNPRSSIIFYRSHLGGFGNLISKCLNFRNGTNSSVTIQSDLTSANLVCDTRLESIFNIQYAGCASHARRPFVLHESEDPELCQYMVHLFRGLYIHEKALDLHDRNRDNTLAVRGNEDRVLWNEIKELAMVIAAKWSKGTKLGTAARYILNHFEKLTLYLDNPYLSLSNDFSERTLRVEKLIKNNSLFRTTLQGRFALDVNRTILQTAIAARVNLQEYIEFVLKSKPDDVKENPEKYTALHYSQNSTKQQDS